ncbi:MAG: efflux RND transporter permease subunit, partial [Gammaproteobacteria bacterium]|nr:efflux RND transporter permease subunit [Gammaproteobacteria bacterium]
MPITRAAISNPTAVIVAIILVTLFGVISLFRLPVQMIPSIERPIIAINTSWRAAAPAEVEADILEPQEDALRGLPGLKKLEATASRGSAEISLEFRSDINLERALIDVINRLNRVPSYPADADEPIIFTGQGRFGNEIAWFSLRPIGGDYSLLEKEIAHYQEFVEEVVQPKIESVPGVASSGIFGGEPTEIRITFDAQQVAALGVNFPVAVERLLNNDDVTSGFNDVGRRQYTVRYEGAYPLHELPNLIVDWRDQSPVTLKDLATVDVMLRDRTGQLSQNGGPSIA